MPVFQSSHAVRAFAIAALCYAGAAHADDSLFQSLGGKESIKAFTKDFVDIVFADPRIKEHFGRADKGRLEFMLSEQFCELAGGPCKYAGRNMRDTHAGMGIDNRAFNALAEDLQIAMERAGVPYQTGNKLIALLAPMQRDIVPAK